jgi:hypothetical protein
MKSTTKGRRRSLAESLSAKQRREMLEWAGRALKGLDASHVFLGILDGKPLDVARVEFLIQLGHAILNDKTLVFPVPHGMEVPKKLEAVADAIIRYNPDDLQTLELGLEKWFTESGKKVQ